MLPMISLRLLEHKDKKSLRLHENDWNTFSKCCDIIEQVFDGVIESKERLPAPVALADVYITYQLKNGVVDINLDEAWGIDIICSSDELFASLKKRMDLSQYFIV